MGERRERKTYTEEQRLELIAEWKETGLSPTRFCIDKGMTPSMFSRWLQLRGHIPMPSNGRVTGGTPKERNSKRHSPSTVATMQAAVAEMQGGLSAAEVAKHYKVTASTIYSWKKKLRNGSTQLVLPADGSTMIPKNGAPRAPANGLEDLQLAPAFDTAAEVKESSYQEILEIIAVVPVQRRLRLLALIDVVSS